MTTPTQQAAGHGSTVGPHCYTASVACRGCGRIGDPHWVDAHEASRTHGLCTICRNPAPK